MKNGCIFVSVASYRDYVCSNTVKSLFEMANNPDKIFIGICQQNKQGDSDCLDEIDDKFKRNIRILRISHEEAKGPTYARYLCSTLWDNEEFYFQIDSHTKCVQNWDTKCIDMIHEIKTLGLSQKPVLSYYPRQIIDYNGYQTNWFFMGVLGLIGTFLGYWVIQLVGNEKKKNQEVIA